MSSKRSGGPALKAKFSISEKGISSVELFPNSSRNGFEWEIVNSHLSPQLALLIDQWIDSYCKKKQPNVKLPIVFDRFPPYTTRVLSILREVPFGITLTYKELAEITGNPLGARAVGNACSLNPCLLLIPCHRVLAINGLGGFSSGLEIKKTLLEYESAFKR